MQVTQMMDLVAGEASSISIVPRVAEGLTLLGNGAQAAWLACAGPPGAHDTECRIVLEVAG
jgi:hypothetical protein